MIETLKLINYKTHAGHDGCNGFNADLSYKGKKIAHAYDDSWGGGIQYAVFEEKLFIELKEEIKKLPKIKTEIGEINTDLDIVIDDLARILDIKKDEKKGILVKHHSGWKIYGWDGLTIPKLISKFPSGLNAIQEYYDKLKKDEEILNANYLQSIGIKL